MAPGSRPARRCIQGLDGQWAAVEVKLGGAAAVSKAMKSLRAEFVGQIDCS